MIDRAPGLCLTLGGLLLAVACGSESLSFESLAGPGQPGGAGAFAGPNGGGAASGSGAVGCQAGFGGAGAGGQSGGPGGSCGAGGTSVTPGSGGSMVGGFAGSGGGGLAGAGGSAGMGPSPAGGASGSGAGAEGGSGGSGVQLGEYREGGYAGSQNVIVDGNSVDGSRGYAACADAGGRSAFVYEEDSCTAGSLCTPPCMSDSECPALAGAPSAECRATLLGQLCALPCEGPSDCPEGMACLEDARFGPSCLFTATPAAPGCDGGCITGDGCGASTECCEGLVCAPWGSCEARECLDFAWACPSAGLPCCGTLTCRDGYCQSP